VREPSPNPAPRLLAHAMHFSFLAPLCADTCLCRWMRETLRDTHYRPTTSNITALSAISLRRTKEHTYCMVTQDGNDPTSDDALLRSAATSTSSTGRASLPTAASGMVSQTALTRDWSRRWACPTTARRGSGMRTRLWRSAACPWFLTRSLLDHSPPLPPSIVKSENAHRQGRAAATLLPKNSL
jgi:hypothetical protein